MSNVSKCFDSKDSESLVIESFGVRIKFTATNNIHLGFIRDRLNNILPKNFKIIENQEVKHNFFIETSDDSKLLLHKNGLIDAEKKSVEHFFDFLESQIRLTIAEFAVDKVFIHAGVVAWKDKAIVIPAKSFKGKTTLVKEFIKIGAIYLSDEYAVIDKDGCAHPFLKSLSVRGIVGKYAQVEIPAKQFGGISAEKPLPVSMVLITEFREKAQWKPKILNSGEGVLEIIPHCLPIRANPKFTLQVLNKVSSRAIICKSFRGEAKNFVKKILEFFEANT